MSSQIKINKDALVLLTFLLIFQSCLFGQVQPDSTILSKDGVIIAQVFNSSKITNAKDFRFYNSQGFFCISLRYEGNRFFTYHKQQINTPSLNRVDTDLDLVFHADTFEIGFINRIIRDKGETFESKFQNTITHYYNAHNYKEDRILSQYIDSIAIAHNLNVPFESIENSNLEQAIQMHNRVPVVDSQDILIFKSIILKDLILHKRFAMKNNQLLFFSIETDQGGQILSIQRLFKTNIRTDKKIDKNINNLIGFKLQSNARGGQKLKGGFYIGLNDER